MPGPLFPWQRTLMSHSYSHRQFFSHKRWTLLLHLQASLELQTCTSASGGKFNTFPTHSGTDGGSNSYQPFRHAKNVRPGSVVLLKNSQVPRNEWPLGLVTQTLPSQDGKVRQVEVKVIKPGGSTLFLRPVTEIVLLLPPDSKVDG